MRVAAVDMGATSVRVAVVDLDSQQPEMELVHRWFHGPDRRPDGSVRWRWAELLENVRLGLGLARRAGPLASIGVDGWAVDYGLLDERGRLLSDPHSYRSPRTEGWRDVARSLGEVELFRRTGVRPMAINTLFQLAAHDRDELQRASHLVMLPELVAHDLTGAIAAERSNAGTTGLLDLESGTWATDLAAEIGVDPAILPPPEPAGRLLGEHDGTPVHLVAAHDTACAFAASPLDAQGSAFVSAGTWFLVGVERSEPDVSEAARAGDFSNELGAVGGYRFLRNVTGFWLLEQCAERWGTTARELLDLAAETPPGPVFDVDDERFAKAARIDDEIRDTAGLPADAPPAAVARSVVESIAMAVGRAVADLRGFGPVERLAVVGGGGASAFVRERLAEHAAAPVVLGSTEATAFGNAIVQGIALGRFAGLGEGRAWLRGAPL